MPNLNRTEIAIVLDRSGSMSSIRKDMEGGFKTFVDGHRGESGECLLSLYQFDNRFEVVYEARPIADVQDLTIEPRGATALLDSLGKTITLISERHDKLAEGEKPAGMLVLVITDGHENASQEWTLAGVRSAVERAEKDRNWRFVFLGADANAFDDARSMGIDTAARYSPSAHGVTNAYEAMLDMSRGFRARVRSGDVESRVVLSRHLSDEKPDKKPDPTR